MKPVLPDHPKPADCVEFMNSLSPVERKLQELAQTKLASCYFMEKTRAYLKWKASKK